MPTRWEKFAEKIEKKTQRKTDDIECFSSLKRYRGKSFDTKCKSSANRRIFIANLLRPKFGFSFFSVLSIKFPVSPQEGKEKSNNLRRVFAKLGDKK